MITNYIFLELNIDYAETVGACTFISCKSKAIGNRDEVKKAFFCTLFCCVLFVSTS